jgi:formylglycine-generating enzyme required for sulfatase activity
MLIQRAGTGTLPPSGFQTPEWSTLVKQWDHLPSPTMALPVLGPAKLTMGHDDSEADDPDPTLNSIEDVVNGTYGWDNESPSRTVEVGAFKAEWRPITNGEYMAYVEGAGDVPIPKSWVDECGEMKVDTAHPYSPHFPLKYQSGPNPIWSYLHGCREGLASASFIRRAERVRQVQGRKVAH